ncbi:SH3 domain-containing protein [Nitrospira defluvii]|nr:SH3 domain-containing protein [Nitrospira defluvii]
MLVSIDIALALFALAAFFAAFGGNTMGESSLLFGGDRWAEGEKVSMYRRITTRGWLAIFCLSITLVLAFNRVSVYEASVKDEKTRHAQLEEENTTLRELISNHVTKIIELKKKSEKAAEDVFGITSQIEAHHLLSIESAFKLSSKPVFEKDETLVHFNGQSEIPLLSRFQGQLHLVGGDQFYFSTFVNNISERELQSIQLEVGEKVYPLFDRPASGFFERILRLPGNPIVPMPATIRNPLFIDQLTLKIFIRPKNTFQGEDIFRALILNSPFSEYAKNIYKVTKADILNVRLDPSPSARVVSRLSRGSFIQKLQEQKGWIEVMTPGGKQGWVRGEFLAEIK